MSVSEKIIEIKKVVSMICDLLPVIVSLAKEIIMVVKEIKTV